MLKTPVIKSRSARPPSVVSCLDDTCPKLQQHSLGRRFLDYQRVVKCVTVVWDKIDQSCKGRRTSDQLECRCAAQDCAFQRLAQKDSILVGLVVSSIQA